MLADRTSNAVRQARHRSRNAESNGQVTYQVTRKYEEEEEEEVTEERNATRPRRPEIPYTGPVPEPPPPGTFDPVAELAARSRRPVAIAWIPKIRQAVRNAEAWSLALDRWDVESYKWSNVTGLLDEYTRTDRTISAGGTAGGEATLSWEEMDAHARRNRLTTGDSKFYEAVPQADGRPRWRVRGDGKQGGPNAATRPAR
jgi:hypothetical protein